MPLKALPHFICPLLSHQTPVYIQTCSNTYHVFVGALLTPRVPSAILPSFVYHSERCLKVYAAAFRPPAPTRCLPPETMKLLSPTSVIFQVVHSNLLIESGRLTIPSAPTALARLPCYLLLFLLSLFADSAKFCSLNVKFLKLLPGTCFLLSSTSHG